VNIITDAYKDNINTIKHVLHIYSYEYMCI